MVTNLVCLENIVGLSNQVCPCLESSKPTNFNTLNESKTGWYITDLSYGAPLLDAILSSTTCQDGSTVWEVLKNVRSAAIQTFLPDLYATVKSKYTEKSTFIEEIGKRNGDSVLSANSSYQGNRLIMNRLNGFKLFVTDIYIGLNETKLFNLTVSSNNPDFPNIVLPIQSTANSFHKNTLVSPLELNFTTKATIDNNYTDNKLYYDFSYNIGTSKYINNEVHCGCSGAMPKWSKFFMFGGFDVPNLNNITCPCSKYGYGMALNGFVVCDSFGWLCNLNSIGDYHTIQTLGETILWKCVELLCTKVLESPNTNFWTTLQRENILGKRSYAAKQYEGRLNFIALNLPKNSDTDCYECYHVTSLKSL